MQIELVQNDLPDSFRSSHIVGIDCESMGLNIKRDRLCLVQIADDFGKVYLVQFNEKNYDAPNLKNLLYNDNIIKIFHFARFDVGIIKQYLDIDVRNIFCTKIASKLSRTYTDHHGLKSLCYDLLGITISKQQQSSNWGNKILSQDQMEYAAIDVIYLHKLMNKLTSMLKENDRYELALNIFKFIPTRVKLDLMGWDNIDIFAHL